MTSQASDSNCFVRPARVEDLEAMGIAHAGAMLSTLQAGSSQELPVSVSAMITPAVLASGWQEAVTNPPSPNHHVLVATQAGAVVGLAALAPDSDGDGEITALAVHPAYQRHGHGSRLLAACADLAKQNKMANISMWVIRGDESYVRLLTSAGLAPMAGAQRKLSVGQDVSEVCWGASL